MRKTNNIYGKCITFTDSESTTTFYPDHYRKVMAVREIKNNTKGFLPDSEYAKTVGSGKKFMKNGKYYYVQAAHKHWYFGYYIMLLTYNIMENGHFSHSNTFIENINSFDETITESIEKNSNIVFEDSTLQEKLDIIISNRKKKNLPAVIHLNKFDAADIETVDITTTPNINELIETHKLSKEPLLLSGGMSWENKQFTNFAMDVIHLDGISEDTYKDLDIIYLHRSFEQ